MYKHTNFNNTVHAVLKKITEQISSDDYETKNFTVRFFGTRIEAGLSRSDIIVTSCMYAHVAHLSGLWFLDHATLSCLSLVLFAF